MTGKDLFREIGSIDEKYITEAEEVKHPVRFSPMLKKSLATVACLCICMGLYFGVRQLNVGMSGESTANSAADAAGQTAGTQGIMAEDSCTMQESEDYFATADTASESTTTNYEATEESVEVDGTVASEPLEDVVYKDDGTSGSMESNSVEGAAPENEECRELRNLEDICNRFAGYSDSYKQNSEEVDAINLHGVLSYGEKELTGFVAAVERGEAAVLELLQVTIEGSPIFYYIQYNGVDFYVVKDARRDEFAGEEPIEECVYKALNVYEQIAEDGTCKVIWVLSEEEDVTLEELEQGSCEYFMIMQYVK